MLKVRPDIAAASVARSTDPADYQAVPRAVAAMAKSFGSGSTTGSHIHERDQLLYAMQGVVRVTTADAAWILPPDRALYIPGGIEHDVAMRGRIEMRTLYIHARTAPGLPTVPVAMEVSVLLRSLILALLEEPILYDEKARGGRLAALILDEIARADPVALVIPMPRDARLVRLCDRLLEQPGCGDTLDQLAHEAGASPRTLSRLFSREVGLSFTQWRQRVRFHNAMEAIVRGEPVGVIAHASGYASASAFTAAFRKLMGVTPGSLGAGKE